MNYLLKSLYQTDSLILYLWIQVFPGYDCYSFENSVSVPVSIQYTQTLII